MGRISSNLLIKKAFASMPFFLLASRQLGVNIAKLFICFKEPLRFLETTFLDKINGTSGPPSPPPPPPPISMMPKWRIFCSFASSLLLWGEGGGLLFLFILLNIVGRNRPIMQCKPLSIEYVMYGYGLRFFYLATKMLHLATIFTP